MKRTIARQLAVYLVIPTLLSALMLGMYFSGNRTLQSIVAPHSFNNMHPDSGREFGLLENTQHAFILVMVIASIVAVFKKPDRIEKALFVLLALFAIFVLLEEIDYGLHYYEYFADIQWHEAAEVRNFHNQGDNTIWMKRIVDLGLIVGFVIVAWVARRIRNPWVRHLAPSRWFVLTLLVLLLTRTVAHELGELERHQAGPLGYVGAISRGNLSEFRELLVYYLFMVYVLTWAFGRDIAHARKAVESSDHGRHA